MNRNQYLWLAAVIVLALPATATGVDWDLQRVNYPDPVIGVTFNEPVRIQESLTNLIYLETRANIGLMYEPDVRVDQNYHRDFEILPSNTQGLGEGDYVLSVVGRNQPPPGYTNPVPATIAFEVTGLQIALLEPENGYSPITPYDVVAYTYVLDETNPEAPAQVPFNARCKYFPGTKDALGLAPNFDTNSNLLGLTTIAPSGDPDQFSGGGTLHRASNVVFPGTAFTVVCQHYKKNGDPVVALSIEEFWVGQLAKGPNITLTPEPARVVNPNRPWTVININTDQETLCTIARGQQGSTTDETPTASTTDFATEHLHIIRYDNTLGVNTDFTDDFTEHEEYYTVTCENKAGRVSHETINVTVNFGEGLSITIHNPNTGLTNDNPVWANITTSHPSTCTVNLLQMNTVDGLEHSKDLTTPPDGNTTAVFYCEWEDKNETVNVTFTNDRLIPTTPTITSSGKLCDGEAAMTALAEDNDVIIKYYWELLANDETVQEGETTSGFVEVSLPLASQEYTWRVWAEDRAGNLGVAATETIISYPGNSDECDERAFINYHQPPLGWDTEPFTPTIETKRPAACGYLFAPGTTENHIHMPSSDGIIHTLPSTSTWLLNEQNFHIRCTEGDMTHEQLMNFGIQTEEILITELVAEPNPARDFQNKEVRITATTNNEATCTLSLVDSVPFDGEDPSAAETYTTTHAHNLNLSFITQLIAETLDYTVTCTDKAGQTDSQPLPIVVDYLSAFDIEVLSPPAATNQADITLSVKPEIPALCVYRDMDSGPTGDFNSMTEANGIYSATFSNVAEGAHTILVRCQNSVGTQAEKTVSFSIDTTPPNVTLTSTGQLCPQSEVAILFEADEELKNVTLDVLLGTSLQYAGNSTNDRYVIEGSNHTTGQFLTLVGRGTDKANNTFEARTNLTVLAELDAACDLGRIRCGNNVTQAGEDCDGPNLGVNTNCSAHGAYTGEITSCLSDCTYDLSTCEALSNVTINVSGCTDSAANNYNPRATTDDGSCRYGQNVSDCTNSTATNYNPRATEDDGTCVFGAPEDPVNDCTDSTAINYNPRATNDDGTCVYGDVEGCTDSNFVNFNPLATIDDGSCQGDFGPPPILTEPGTDGSEDEGPGNFDDPFREPNNDEGMFDAVENEEFSWIALVLLLIGLILMGGASYYLYVADINRQTPVQKQTPSTPLPVQRETAVQRLHREQQERQAFEKKAQESKEERHALTKQFEDEKEQTLQERKAAKTTEEKKQKAEENAEKKTKDVFDRLDEFIEEEK